jgi:hypothetical protein
METSPKNYPLVKVLVTIFTYPMIISSSKFKWNEIKLTLHLFQHLILLGTKFDNLKFDCKVKKV